jgi:hypothetical protein
MQFGVLCIGQAPAQPLYRATRKTYDSGHQPWLLFFPKDCSSVKGPTRLSKICPHNLRPPIQQCRHMHLNPTAIEGASLPVISVCEGHGRFWIDADSSIDEQGGVAAVFSDPKPDMSVGDGKRTH